MWIFLAPTGYSYGVKGDKLWDSIAHKVIHSKSINFSKTKSSSVTLDLNKVNKKM